MDVNGGIWTRFGPIVFIISDKAWNGDWCLYMMSVDISINFVLPHSFFVESLVFRYFISVRNKVSVGNALLCRPFAAHDKHTYIV